MCGEGKSKVWRSPGHCNFISVPPAEFQGWPVQHQLDSKVLSSWSLQMDANRTHRSLWRNCWRLSRCLRGKK